MDETQVTTLWMAGVVLMMLVFAVFAVIGYKVRGARERKTDQP